MGRHSGRLAKKSFTARRWGFADGKISEEDLFWRLEKMFAGMWESFVFIAAKWPGASAYPVYPACWLASGDDGEAIACVTVPGRSGEIFFAEFLSGGTSCVGGKAVCSGGRFSVAQDEPMACPGVRQAVKDMGEWSA
jgi:hypothetical protein